MMPLAAKIVFTVILGVSIVSSFFKNYAFADIKPTHSKHWKNCGYAFWLVLTFFSWAWRIELIVYLWAF